METENQPIGTTPANVLLVQTSKEMHKSMMFKVISVILFDSSGHFNKIHKRKFHSFGCIHQSGKLPGAMF